MPAGAPIRLALSRLETTSLPIVHLAERAPVLRVLRRLGPDRLLRTVALVFWIAALVLEPLYWRPDLLHPSDLSTDSSNYAAATERLAAGHDLYALVPGDRPTPLDNPPDWSVPILSPPPIASVGLWQLVLPEAVRFYVTWAVGLAAMAALGLVIIAYAPAVFVLIFLYLAGGLAATAWSGNVNALIGPGAVLVWWSSRQERMRWQVTAGAVAAVAAAVKIGPLFLLVWLIAQRRWKAVIASLATGLAVMTATILIAGPNVIVEYLGIARSTTATPTSLSIPGLLRAIGMSEGIQALALPAATLVAVAAIFYWRRSPLSFTIAVLAMIFSTPVVRHESIALAISASVAWIPSSSLHGAGTGLPTRAAIGRAVATASGLGVIAVLASLATGGLDRSSVSIVNRTAAPVVVRFSTAAQTASFGFVAPVGEPVYGWRDRAGGSPPVATIWSAECALLDVINLPRTGAAIEFDESGGHRASDDSSVNAAFAAFVPDCAGEVAALLKTP